MQRRQYWAWKRSNGEVGGTMTEDELGVFLDTILNDTTIFDKSEDKRLHGKSLAMLIEETDFVFYIGMVSTSCYNNDNERVTRQRNVCVRRSN
jgi:hypothetical protein